MIFPVIRCRIILLSLTYRVYSPNDPNDLNLSHEIYEVGSQPQLILEDYLIGAKRISPGSDPRVFIAFQRIEMHIIMTVPIGP